MSAPQKVITFTIPCFNSSAYMDACIESLLIDPEGVEIIIVNDGSTKDDTGAKADAWAAKHPDIIKAVHQPNGGHGEAVNTGLREASGVYFKVVDSDDWLDRTALRQVLAILRGFIADGNPVDLLVTNYVYEHSTSGSQKVIHYKGALPRNRQFTWDEVGNFLPAQNILMHAATYRTQLLRDCGLTLPKHTFYVDNIFVYVPLPYVRSLYYLPVDLYRYFIGRDDQSVSEKNMIARYDQQLLITRTMIDAHKLPEAAGSKRLAKYMEYYLSLMMAVCSILAILSERPDALKLRDDIWDHLRDIDENVQRRLRWGLLGFWTNLPGQGGRAASKQLYRIAQRLYRFN